MVSFLGRENCYNHLEPSSIQNPKLVPQQTKGRY